MAAIRALQIHMFALEWARLVGRPHLSTSAATCIYRSVKCHVACLVATRVGDTGPRPAAPFLLMTDSEVVAVEAARAHVRSDDLSGKHTQEYCPKGSC